MEIDKKRYKEIKNLAQNCSLFFDTSNPFSIFEKLNIEYSTLTLQGDLGGFVDMTSVQDQKFYHVYVNAKYDAISQQIIAAHELGHILLHKHDALNIFEEHSFKSSIREYEANIFALELLPHLKPRNIDYLYLSKEGVRKYINSKLNLLSQIVFNTL